MLLVYAAFDLYIVSLYLFLCIGRFCSDIINIFWMVAFYQLDKRISLTFTTNLITLEDLRLSHDP